VINQQVKCRSKTIHHSQTATTAMNVAKQRQTPQWQGQSGKVTDRQTDTERGSYMTSHTGDRQRFKHDSVRQKINKNFNKIPSFHTVQ